MRNGLSDLEIALHSGGMACKCCRILKLLLLGLGLCLAGPELHSQTLPGSILTQHGPPAPPEQQASPPQTSPPAKPSIPLPQIADQAEDLERQLREISKHLNSPPELMDLEEDVEAHARQFRDRARQTEELLAGIPNVMQLQDEERYWKAFVEQHGNQRKLLTNRAADIEEKIRWLDTQQKTWQATWDQVQPQSGLEVVAQRVRSALDQIQQLRTEAQQQLGLILTSQNRISEQDREISAVQQELREAYERLRARLLERDSYPLWAIRELHTSDRSLSTAIRVAAGRGSAASRNFLRSKMPLLILTAGIYLFALLMAFGLTNYLASKNGQDAVEGSQLLQRPFSGALLVTLFATFAFYFSAPSGVLFVEFILCLIPVLRLLPPLVGPGMRKVVYTLCAFYLVEWLYLVLQFGASFQREFFALIIVLALAIFAWLTRPSRLKVQIVTPWRPRLLLAGTSIGLFLLAASLLANILGFFSLSQVLGLGTVFSAFALALLYTMVRVLRLGLVILVSSAWFQSLPDAHADAITRWGWRLLMAGATFVWLNVVLYLFAVRPAIVGALQSVLQYQMGFGKFHVTLGGILSLIFLLVLGYAIANIASFFLGSILLPNVTLKGGMAYAISRVTYYVLLVGLFFAALSTAGLELNKFTLITGALGVGVGFGLQNIVNNFASGLIVLFERPIRVSDTVEVAGVSGIVRRIGARSSTVLTAQGAEVIFPNSTLVSNQVINWTLSSARRRVEIPVGVSYSADPDLVLKLLTEVATANSRVLTYPAPETAFLGFGENALRFQLTFWASQPAWFELQSEVGLAVFRALRQAGIEIPFPQRDLHLRSLDSAMKEELSTAADKTPTRKMVAR